MQAGHGIQAHGDAHAEMTVECVGQDGRSVYLGGIYTESDSYNSVYNTAPLRTGAAD